MKKGIIKFFNEEKGFGFIVPEKGSGDIFVHVTGIKYSNPQQDDFVSYEEAQGKKGLNAVNVKLA